MANIDATTWETKRHTKAKHQILEEYLKQWFPILGTTASKVIYLDGFAGSGAYSTGEEGSPIIAIRTAFEHRLAEQFNNIIFRFIEKKKERVESLDKIIRNKFPNLPENFHVDIQTSEFASDLEKILTDLENNGAELEPTFAFVDPFGYSDIPMRLITRILRYERCEVFITFMSSFALRFINDENKESALDDLFWTNEWRQIRQIHNPKEKREHFLDLYVKQLRERGGAKFYKTFEMIGMNNQIIYHLVFATKNIKGLKAMKKAMWKVGHQGTFKFSDRTNPDQTFLLDYSDRKIWIPQASNIVYNKLAGKTMTLEDVEEFVLVETPFIFQKSILVKLEKDSKITNVERTIEKEKRRRKYSFPERCIITFLNKTVKN